MARRMEPLANKRTSAVIIAAALLLCGEARAQSSGGGGLQNFFDNIFTGAISNGNQTAPSGQRPGASAQPTPDTGSAPPPWGGEDGPPGHPLMATSAIRSAAAQFDPSL